MINEYVSPRRNKRHSSANSVSDIPDLDYDIMDIVEGRADGKKLRSSHSRHVPNCPTKAAFKRSVTAIGS